MADALLSKGYRIALAARSVKPKDSTSDRLLIPVDLSNTDSIAPAFASLRKQWGEPGVVFYNGIPSHPKTPTHPLASLTYTTAAAVHFTDPTDPLFPSVPDFTQDLTINTISLYATIKESLSSFETLPSSTPKTFIYTGNSLNVSPQPAFTTLGVGKTASAHIVELASGAYGEKGYK